MGTYFNPDNESFQRDVNSRIYVDKTGLLEELNQVLCSSENCIALSHARRFGKSQAAGMIDAYYSIGSDSKELFSGFEIAQKPDFEKHLNQYNVIHVDVASFTDRYREGLVEKLWGMLYDEMAEECGELMDASSPVGAVLMQVYKKSGRKLVIILDEWD